MKKIKKYLFLINNCIAIIIAAILTLAAIDIYNFLNIKNESELMKNRITGIIKEIKQLEKEKNKIYRQSSSLKKRQLALIEINKNLIEKNIGLSNENMLLVQRIGELTDNEPYILVDTKENILYFKQKGQIIRHTRCSVGKGGILSDKKTRRKWEFVTPKGIFTIKSKTENPLWFKPDWAFIEEKKEIPLPNSPERKVEGELGKYALDLGFGYKIHGTQKEELLGRAVSHGCIRLGADDLEYIYKNTKINKTLVYVY
ncbi:MAG: L,D-transpeptidase [Elusimicrobia bacterium]|nr:L,D-transpeptidase [Elusimicrobiota bacterium]